MQDNDTFLGGAHLKHLSPFAEILSQKGVVVRSLPKGEPVVLADRREHTFGGVLTWKRFQANIAAGVELEWACARIPGRQALSLRTAIHNRSATPLRLEGIGLAPLCPGGLQLPGGSHEWWLGFHKDTPAATLAERLSSRNDRVRAIWKSFGMDAPPFPLIECEHFEDGRWRKFRDWFSLARDKGRECLAGAAVGAEADVDFDFFVDPEAGHALELTSRMSGIRVDPGESRCGDRIVLAWGEFDDVVPWLFRWMGDTLGARTHRPPLVGWCSWYDRYREVAEPDIVGVCDVAARERERISLDVIQIDDGYQRQLGDWECNEKFPSGFEPLCRRIRQSGAEPAIWISPLQFSVGAGRNNLGGPEGSLIERHPEWFQRNASGELIGKGSGWGQPHYLLDPSHPGAQMLIRQMLRRLKQAGFTYFKIDFNTLQEAYGWEPSVPCFSDPKKTRLQVFRDLYRLYREVLGDQTYILACVCELIRGPIGYADAQRIGPDSDPTWTGKANLCCIDACLQAVAATAHANGILFQCDPDVTYLRERGHKGPPITRDEWKSWHSVVGLLGGATFISEPLQAQAYQDDEQVRALEILTPPAPEKARAIHPGTDYQCRRFGMVCRRQWGDHACLLLHNPEQAGISMALDWDAQGLAVGAFHAWSFWDQEYLGLHEETFELAVCSHGCRLLRITPARSDGLPVLVGSTLHITMGAAEIATLRRTARELSVELTDAGSRDGVLTFVGPQPKDVSEVRGMHSATMESHADSVWAIVLRGRRRGQTQSVHVHY